MRDIGKTKERKSDMLGTHWSWIQESLEGRVNFEKGVSEKLSAIMTERCIDLIAYLESPSIH